MKLPKALLLVGAQRGFGGLLGMRVDIGKRKMAIYDADFTGIISLHCLQCREQAAAERTLKVRKFNNRDRRSLRPARRVAGRGHFGPKRIQVRLHSILSFQTADERLTESPSTLLDQVLADLGQRLIAR